MTRKDSREGDGGVKNSGTYNAVVIGGGTAGLVTAAGTAGLGGRVALAERHLMGGDCLNTGCVPSKALIASARAAQQMRDAGRVALTPAEPAFRFEDVMARVRERRAVIAPHDSKERFESLGVDVFLERAEIVSPHEVRVGDRVLRTRHIVIATGSRASIPKIEGLVEARPFTNETIFDALERRPPRLVVLGGGPIGCELGQAFTRLGIRVTILQSAPRILTREDADAADVVRSRLEREGATVITEARVRRVTRENGLVRVSIEGRDDVVGEEMLVAAGRAPNVEGLGLDAVGVAYDDKGVKVNARLQTTRPHIYAAGDVTGGPQFTHVADHHARVVVRNMLLPWPKARADLSVLTWATYTSPEIGRVGLNESEARTRGITVDVWTQPLATMDRAVVDGETEGFVKVLTRRGSDRIVGATVVAERGGDLVHEIALAMRARVGLSGLSSLIHAYPSYAETARRIGDNYQRTRLTPRVRQLLTALYRWRRGD
jgi:pyruvate/2-oxoglutarate dehydrogenase complex dihydrolipoamide dehydrogenase (E3) component